jgi:hypothetical protein
MSEIRLPVTIKTQSEVLFEMFCQQNQLDWERVPAGTSKTHDFNLRAGAFTVAVEIEQIESLRGLNPTGVSSRVVGSHVRHKITEARGQLQIAARSGVPAILLIHNTIDPMQLFGTEQHDFICAMYGELTVHILGDSLGRPFHGRNARLRSDANTSFSAVGHLMRHGGGAKITVYENVYAANPLPFGHLPPCIDVVRVAVEDAA